MHWRGSATIRAHLPLQSTVWHCFPGPENKCCYPKENFHSKSAPAAHRPTFCSIKNSNHVTTLLLRTLSSTSILWLWVLFFVAWQMTKMVALNSLLWAKQNENVSGFSIIIQFFNQEGLTLSSVWYCQVTTTPRPVLAYFWLIWSFWLLILVMTFTGMIKDATG